MEVDRKIIFVETGPHTGTEIEVCSEEARVTDEVIMAVRRNPKLLGPMALALAHRKTEEQEYQGDRILFGNDLIDNITRFEIELREDIAQVDDTAQVDADTL